MIETNLIIVLDLCVVFVVLKFFSRGREKTCPLTNHKVKRSALFINTISTTISNFGNYPVVIGGDWNCTISCEPSPSNIDTLNMQNPPNLRHSNLVKKLC